MTLSNDIRVRAVHYFDSNLHEQGLWNPKPSRHVAAIAAADRLEVSVSAVKSWVDQRAETGVVGPLRKRNKSGLMEQDHFEYLAYYLNNVNCQLFGDEMADLIELEFGVRYDEKLIYATLDHNNYTRKVIEKIAAEQDAEERAAFRHDMRPISEGGVFCPSMFVFVDETHMTEGQARRKYGWALHGEPAFRRLFNTHGHNEAFSSIASMWICGINSVTTFEDGVNAEKFFDTIRDVIIPTMNPMGQVRSILVLDNASVHDKDALAVLCAGAGVGLIFLPPYSYDFNPIEKLFHMAKGYTRRHHNELHEGTLIAEFEWALWNCCTADQACNLYKDCYFLITREMREYANL
jgi:transposase